MGRGIRSSRFWGDNLCTHSRGRREWTMQQQPYWMWRITLNSAKNECPSCCSTHDCFGAGNSQLAPAYRLQAITWPIPLLMGAPPFPETKRVGHVCVCACVRGWVPRCQFHSCSNSEVRQNHEFCVCVRARARVCVCVCVCVCVMCLCV